MIETTEDLVKYVVELYKIRHAAYKRARDDLASFQGLCLLSIICVAVLFPVIFLIWQDFEVVKKGLVSLVYASILPAIYFCQIQFRVYRAKVELNRYKQLLWLGGIQVFAKDIESLEPELVIARDGSKDDKLHYVERNNYKIDFKKYNKLFRIS